MKNLYIILLVLPLIGFGQGWEVTFGGEGNDIGLSVQQTLDGGYIVCGTTTSFGNGNTDVYLIKTDGNGEEEWSQTFGGELDDYGLSVQQTTDEGYIISGNSNSFGVDSPKIYLIKTDGNGEEEWSQTFGQSGQYWGKSVQQTTDGGYVVTGWFSSPDFIYDFYILKTDENGQEQWFQIFGEIGWNVSKSIQQTSDGGYVVCGGTSSEDNGTDLFILKTDQSGQEQWFQTFGQEQSDIGYSIQQTTDGGYIITGETSNGIGDGPEDIYIVKTNENGDLLWTNILDGERGNSVQQTIDGGYIICGDCDEPIIDQNNELSSDNNVSLVKTNENGEEEWSQKFGNIGILDEGCNSVQQTIDGGYILCGYSEELVGQFEDSLMSIYLIKTDSQGNITSTIELPTPTGKRELVKTTNILGQENTTIKNQPLIEIYDDGSVEKKYIIE